MYGENDARHVSPVRATEPYLPAYWKLLTRLNTRSNCEKDSPWSQSHYLRGLVGSNILLDGDPQTGFPAFLVLIGNRSRLSV